MAANVRYTGEPQVGQKPRVFTLPLSPTMSDASPGPSVARSAAREGQIGFDARTALALTVAALAVIANIGSPRFHSGSHRTRSDRHKPRSCLVSFFSVLFAGCAHAFITSFQPALHSLYAESFFGAMKRNGVRPGASRFKAGQAPRDYSVEP